MNMLKAKRKSMQHSVDEAIKNGALIEDVVTIWFQSADDAINVAEKIIEDHDSANSSCFIHCPNLNTRYQFSRKAKKHTPFFAEVEGERSCINKIFYHLDVQELETLKDYEALRSRTNVLTEIVGALKNVDFNLIGVYGLPGVGKTVLATQHLIDEVKRDGVFKVVTWAKVTQTPDLKTIQEEIAAWLSLKFDVSSTQVRAVRLCARLKQEEKILIILDDIWGEIKLEEIGIPIDKDSKGCKILMTSRYRNVLSAMGTQKDFILQVLQNDEAWQLFQKKLGNTIDSNLRSIASEVSKRCAGLPVLITAVATALRKQDLATWKDSLERLKQFDHEKIDDKVNSALELSYNFLKAEAKLVFLLCGQNGPLNIDIKYLLKYGLGLGIFKSCDTVEAARNRLHSLVNDLKASCLVLESGNKDGVLHMHDLVHNFSITTASKEPVLISSRMSDWPEDDTLENCAALVLTDRKIPRFSEVLNCPKLRFFLLNNGNLSLEIGDNFFGGMIGLRVLNLKNASFSSMPSSLQSLEDLQTLCLDSCVLEDVNLIGELKKLQALSLVNCTIICLPREIGNLTHLKLLDLKDCSSLEVIEPDVLSSLTELEELYMENSFLKWEDNEANNGKHENANLAELDHLSKLVTLHMHVMDANMLPKDLQLVKQLVDFKILIGEEWDWNVEYKTSRTLKLKLNTMDHLERVQGFLMRTEDLYLDDLKDVKNVLDNLDGEGFPQLKHLLVQNSPGIQYIIYGRWISHVTAFPSLESLSLNNLNKLETISNAPLKIGSFGSLRRLEVGNCSSLRNLFLFSMFRDLKLLEEIDVSSCKIMEMIAEDDGGQDEAIKLEKLRRLTLDHLPQFASFCSQLKLPTIARTGCAEIIPDDETEISLVLFSEKIDFPNLVILMLTSINVENIWSNQLRDVSVCTKNLTSLIVDGCWNLVYVFTSSMLENFAQLENLEISNCSSMREVILTERSEEGMLMTREKILFPKLDFLKLKHLPKLERFCSGNLIECPLLNVLWVESCPYLQTFVSSSMFNDVGITTLFDEKVLFPELEVLEIFHMHKLRMIWKNEHVATGSFGKLKVLKVVHAKELSQLFPSNMLVRALRNLETVVVKNCDIMEQVFDMEGLVQSNERHVVALRTLDLQYMRMLKRVWNGDTCGIETVSWNNLRSVTLKSCDSLKSFFPASIATNLLQLEKLNLSNCVKLEEVIAEALATSPTFFFPKLKYIQLFQLYELRNFYPGAHTLECPVLDPLWVASCSKLELFALDGMHVQSKTLCVQPLFSIAQVVPNLKQMTLTYKDVMMLTQGYLPTHLFHRLTEIGLQYFQDGSSCFEIDLLRRFQNIIRLHVMQSNFEELFPFGLAGDDPNVGILAQIRFLKFNYLPNLRRIWNQESLHKQVLQNIETFEVYRCNGLISLLPSFASFQNLQSLDVENCHGLVSLLESMAANSLVHLRTMSIKECNMVKEIVATDTDEIQTEISLIKLESLKLHCLKSLVCFSFANCAVKFPSLTEIIVTQCPKMKFFSLGNVYAPKLKRVYITEEGDRGSWVGNLNSTIKQQYVKMAGFDGMQRLELSEFPELKEKWLGQLPVSFFYNLTSLVVDDCAFQSVAIPSNLLPALIALEKLEIRNCNLLKELFELEWPNADRNFGYLSNLKEFQLIDLPQLMHVWDEIPKDMLDLKNLTLLKFHNCSSLRNILTPTMCLGLVQLKTLQVTSCQMVQEIITPPASKDTTTVVFPSLEHIIFKDLSNLTGFYSGTGSVECNCLKQITITRCPKLNITNTILESKDLKPSSVQKIWNCQSLTSLMIDGLRNLKFMFSSSVAKSLVQLKKVEISNCGMLGQVIVVEVQDEQIMRLLKLEFLKLKDLPKLTQFSICNMLECPFLKELQIESCPQLMAFVSDPSSSNVIPNSELQIITPALFDEKVAFPNLEQMEVIKMDNLRMIWNNKLHSDSFSKLEVLKVEHSKQLIEIFPQNILARLRNLKDLLVKNCHSLEEVFDIHGLINAKETERVTSQLKTLDIRNVLNLRSVWNEDPKGAILFCEISSISVLNCPNLKSLFPFSIAKSLQQLEDLELDSCGVVELVTREKGIVEEAPKFVFPRLKELDLWKLENLEFFFQGIHTMDCPVLERLSVYKSDKLDVFTETAKNPPETQMNKSWFSFAKIISNMEHVSLTSKDAVMIKESQFPPQLFDKLNIVELYCFDNESDVSLSDMLKLFHNMKSLYVRSSMFEELFPSDGLDQVLQTLELLYVYDCDNLINLSPSSASFQNLTDLGVSYCEGLVSLMGHSTARSLMQLQKMSIKECDNMLEIISNEEPDAELKEEIFFTRLQSLELNCLPSLVSFCSAEYNFKFPSLTRVIVSQCPNIKFFSGGVSTTPELKRVELSETENWRWVGDLNSTVKQLYVDMVGFNGMQHLKLSEFPELKEKWLGQLPVNFFYNLASLVVDDCEFQSVAIPYNLLPFLSALEKLQIRNCELLEELFDLESLDADRGFGYLSNLKDFQLIDLPKLRHVWDEIPTDMLDVKNLTLLKFHNCSSLRTVLTPTICLDLVKLKSLQVTSCVMVEEIISPPASKDTNTTISPIVVFPLLECIIFEDLPNITGFYSGIGSVECRCLKEISIARCPQLNITNTIPESKVVCFPHLKDLKPSSIDIQKIWKSQSLTSLMIDGFKNLKFLFSSSVAKSLIHLKKVEISNCEMLEHVIDMEEQDEQMMRLLKIDLLKLKDLPILAQFCTCDMLECTSLKEMQIENCPQLMAFVSDSNVVPNNELQTTSPALFDEKVAFPNLEKMKITKMDNLRMIWSNQLYSESFGELEVLKVKECKQLMEIFPHNILARLHNLNDLVIKNCSSLEEVFDIHGLINAEEMERVTTKLKTLDIENLPNLRCIWNEDPKGVVLFDELTSLCVWECPNLKSLFPFSIGKSLTQLEDLDLNDCGVVELIAKEKEAVEEAPKFVFPCLKFLDLWDLENLECFFRGIHTLDCPVLNRLSVSCCEKFEVFSYDPPEKQIQESLFSFSKMISNLEHVTLTSKDAVMIKESQFPPQFFDKLEVVELHCFNSESGPFSSDLLKLFCNMETLDVRRCMFKELFPHEGLEKTFQTLKILNVDCCGNLIKLAPFEASFENLTELDVDDCKGLVSLMGLSTARSLVQLQKMSITNCEKVSEIVSNEGSEDGSKEEIVFTRLERLELNDLPSLASFCAEECNFKFPFLTQVIVSQCPNMEFFSRGASTTPELKSVQLSEADEGHWNGNLNATVLELFTDE